MVIVRELDSVVVSVSQVGDTCGRLLGLTLHGLSTGPGQVPEALEEAFGFSYIVQWCASMYPSYYMTLQELLYESTRLILLCRRR